MVVPQPTQYGFGYLGSIRGAQPLPFHGITFIGYPGMHPFGFGSVNPKYSLPERPHARFDRDTAVILNRSFVGLCAKGEARPMGQELENLMAWTGLERGQIIKWFANNRVRPNNSLKALLAEANLVLPASRNVQGKSDDTAASIGLSPDDTAAASDSKVLGSGDNSGSEEEERMS